jgi:osmotically-inducible protein OsmY
MDASHITVNVRGGEVTLSGTVMNRGQKRRAEILADLVNGVRDVINVIRIAGIPAPDRPDTGV